ncbi:MAG: class I SAM-dependent methyltransferase, partial [Solirubrobacteraceae bacterium]
MDPEELRNEHRARWEQVAAGWGRRADHLREVSLPVSRRMVESLRLSPGQRVLELAAGPGDTGFLAARMIAPGTLVTSDGSEAMLEIARARARELALDNVEFNRLELEWIDLPTASVDAVICRWGLMLCVDPSAAASEIR